MIDSVLNSVVDMVMRTERVIVSLTVTVGEMVMDFDLLCGAEKPETVLEISSLKVLRDFDLCPFACALWGRLTAMRTNVTNNSGNAAPFVIRSGGGGATPRLDMRLRCWADEEIW